MKEDGCDYFSLRLICWALKFDAENVPDGHALVAWIVDQYRRAPFNLPASGILAEGLLRFLRRVDDVEVIMAVVERSLDGLQTFHSLPDNVLAWTRLVTSLIKREKPAAAIEDKITAILEALDGVMRTLMESRMIITHVVHYVATFVKLGKALGEYDTPAFHAFIEFLHERLLQDRAFWHMYALNFYGGCLESRMIQVTEQELDMMCDWVTKLYEEEYDNLAGRGNCHLFTAMVATRRPEFALSKIQQFQAEWQDPSARPSLALSLFILYTITDDNPAVQYTDEMLVEMVAYIVSLGNGIGAGCHRAIELCRAKIDAFPKFQFRLLVELINIIHMMVWSPEIWPGAQAYIEVVFTFCHDIVVLHQEYLPRLQEIFHKEAERFAQTLGWLQLDGARN
jgi:hypothetical protein